MTNANLQIFRDIASAMQTESCEIFRDIASAMQTESCEIFRDIASAMQTESCDWEWIGPHMSQRMFGITQTRAEAYAQRYGGTARRMPTNA